MENRLINILETIWKKSIADTYLNGLICSERQLQAELYRQLRNQTDYLIWVEPELELKNTALHHTKPDMIISSLNNKIIGVIELKFNLSKGIDVKWDIEKLTEFSQLNREVKIPLLTNLINGGWDYDNQFILSDNLVVILAVIAWKDTEALDTEKLKAKFNIKNEINMYHLIGSVNENDYHFSVKKL